MATKKSSPVTKKTKRLLTDAHIEALSDFSVQGLIWDAKVAGLRLRVGPRRASWSYFQQHRLHGKRSTTCKTLGHWPSMNVSDARKAALMIAGNVAAGHIMPGRKSAKKLPMRLPTTSAISHARPKVKANRTAGARMSRS